MSEKVVRLTTLRPPDMSRETRKTNAPQTAVNMAFHKCATL